MPGTLEEGAIQVVRRLSEHGYEAYLVGGCVRDKQLQRNVKDYDIATSARPEQVLSLFQRTIPTGLQHGTVTVLIGRMPYEVTTFRKEGGYEAYRRPTEVEYIDSLQEDLQRRDFTMNAMAIDKDGRLIDPFGGMDDIRRGILRCVGEAEERFREDALRMLRCLRFAAEYGLRVDDSTWSALLGEKHLLRHIAMERVRVELERMVGGADPDLALELLRRSGVLAHTKQELKLAKISDVDRWPELDKLPDALHRFAYMYVRLAVSAEQTERDLRELTFSKQQIEAVRNMVAAHEMLNELLSQPEQSEQSAQPMQEISANRADLLKRHWIVTAIRFGRQALNGVRTLYLLEEEPTPAQRLWTAEGERWLQALPASELSELAVSGEQLMMRFAPAKPGPWLGRLLAQLLEDAALGLVPNETEALLQAADTHYVKIRETTNR